MEEQIIAHKGTSDSPQSRRPEASHRLAQLEQQNGEYRSWVQAIERSMAVIEFEIDGTIITANDVFLRGLGYSLDEIKGRHHRMFVDPGQAASADYQRF